MNPASHNLRISILIANYNYTRFIGETIESVLAQTVQPLEIIVGDDGSTDNSLEVLAGYGDRIRVVSCPHQGVSVLRNQLLKEARGDWCLMVDADDLLAPNFLEKMQDAIRGAAGDERVVFAYPDSECFGEREGRISRPAFDAQLLKRGNYVVVTSLVRMDVARRFGFDKAFNTGQGDYDFYLSIVKNGYRGIHVSEAVLHYRIHGSSITSGVLKQRRQRNIMRRLLRKHRDFFTREEAQAAMRAASNRHWARLIEARSPFAGWGCRLNELWQFVRGGLNHAEIFQQALYAVSPTVYFQRRYPAADVFYLFRDTAERRRMVARLPAANPNQTQLFGYAELAESGLSLDCNLRLPRISSVRETVAGWIERWYAPRAGVGLGDVTAVRAHLWQMNRARVVVATTDNTGLPAARLKAKGKLKAKLIYISVGLPERMAAVRKISPAREARYRRMLSHVDQFIAYGHAEAEWLREWLGTPEKVQFVPFGVDTEKWRPVVGNSTSTDILSIGSDPMRDFKLLVEFACRHPEYRICLITGTDWVKKLENVPANMELKASIPIEQVQRCIAEARVVVLPIRENSYSGATTTLLQCMAMGKAVAVSRVGAIRNGYGLEDGDNICWLEPGSQIHFNEVLGHLLDQPLVCKEIGDAARQHVVRQLSWVRYVEGIQGCIREQMMRP